MLSPRTGKHCPLTPLSSFLLRYHPGHQVKVLGMELLILEMDYKCARYHLSTKFGPHMKEDQIISELPSLNPHNFRKVSPCLVPTANPTTRCSMGGFLQGETTRDSALKQPIDYTLVWSSEALRIKQDGVGYIWLPSPPDGYKAVGHVVTNSPQKPPLGKTRCVRSDLTDECEIDAWIWGPGKESDPNGFNVYSLLPRNRGTRAMGVCVGTFVAQNTLTAPVSLACVKNVVSNLSCMPNRNQIQTIFQAYSPWIYFHPDEQFLPSSVNWYFKNGAFLYKKGDESRPVPIESDGSNLPQGGAEDDMYWLDLPVDEGEKDRVKKGNLQESQVYLHIKPMLGATFTDVAVWVFYPFNGPSRAKVEFINIPLGKIGEHVGDWEHVTLRISNFNGELRGVYFSEHSGGAWVKPSELEFQDGNKAVTYSSLHGHAMFARPGLVLQGRGGIGIRNDTAKSKKFMDTGTDSLVVAAEYLGTAINEPPWLDYFRKWGPKITYDISEEIKKVDKLLPGKTKICFRQVYQESTE
ncbi:VACUOLAR PROTEIN SORTING-ASSOCIATED PROTEIN 62-RELATED [Salix purpurea]|uniref:VACUOLAR PROTEIN SORTING-ASSOCIATED PROTEIN 62-RELATED n=1 Tax=Salix purpurea TaxID=77065 RepID=A0A9Q0PNQ8_SALPP|nr:VACUOLAR PROTEIN SORTING-ASSOCIATED PROTEIN 62-RELATED [Salix purpurea]